MIRTSFEATATATLATGPGGPYRELIDTVQRATARTYHNPVLSSPPEAVARVVERAVTDDRPATRYVVTVPARLLVHTRRLLGARVFDAVNRLQFR
jgi:hypothetical protein